MLQGQPEPPRWAPEPYALRRGGGGGDGGGDGGGGGFEGRLLEEMAAFGHQLALLAEFVPSCGADK